MTLVWKTRYGGKFHRYASCSGIADGQQKAAAEGKQNHPVLQIELLDIDNEIRPCSVCWAEPIQADRWLPTALVTEAKADSHYEVDFFERVLRRVDLDPDYLSVQHEVTGSSGKRYRVDFAVVGPGPVRLAIEIDGFQKDNRRNEADEARQSSAATRQNDITAAGWMMLHFTNRQVSTSPGECRIQLEAALAGLRPNSRAAPTPAAARVSGPAPTSPGPSTTTSAAKARGPWHSRSSARWAIGVGSSLLLAALISLAVLVGAGGSDGADPVSGSCPADHPVKGNVSDNGRLYHLPGWQYYQRTDPEACFATAEDAEEQGYRASLVK